MRDLLCWALLFLSSAGLFAFGTAWQENGVPVSVGTNLYDKSDVTTNNAGLLVRTWSDSHLGDQDVFMQAYNELSQPQWGTAPVVVAGGTGCQLEPQITATSDGGVVVIWLNGDGFYPNMSRALSVAKFNASGVMSWTHDTVLDATYEKAAENHYFHVVADDQGGVFVASSYRTLRVIHYDAEGNSMWGESPVEGGSGGDYCRMMYDQQDGVIYTLMGSNQNMLLGRVTSSGNAWNIPLSGLAYHDISLAHISGSGSGSYFACLVPEEDEIVLHRFDALGNMQPDSLSISTGGFWYTVSGLAQLNDSMFFDWIGSDPSEMHLVKVHSDGTLTWQVSLPPMDNLLSIPSDPLPSVDGGCYLTNMTYDNVYTCQLQYFNVSGSPMWGAQGMVIYDNQNTLANNISCTMVNDNVAVSWMSTSAYNGLSLRTQTVTPSGDFLLAPEGVTVVGGSTVLVFRDKVLRHGYNTVTIWQAENGRIYLQELRADGSSLWSQGGLFIGGNAIGNQFDAAIDPQGNVGVLWTYTNDEGLGQVQYQCITADGQFLCGETGLPISTAPSTSAPRIAATGDQDFRLLWINTELITSDYGENYLYAQRVLGTQPQWAEGGIVISPDASVMSEENAIVGSTLLWCDLSAHMRALRLDPDGNPAVGWNAEGLRLSAPYGYVNAIGGYTAENGDLYVYWSGDYTPFLRFQKISPEGQLLLGTDSICLISDILEKPAVSFVGDRILIVYTRYSDYKTLAQCFDDNLNPLWGDQGVLLSDDVYIPSFSSLIPVSTEDQAGYLVFYSACPSDQLRLYMQFLSSDGTPQWSPGGNLVNSGGFWEDAPQAVAIDDHSAVVVWRDSRADYETFTDCGTGISDLYAQRVYVTAVDTNDGTQDVTRLAANNYPNPFNPTTTIAYSLPAAGKVTLSVYNLRGQLVKRLVEEQQVAGAHNVVWNGTDAQNRNVASGVYFYRLETGNRSIVKKMVMMK